MFAVNFADSWKCPIPIRGVVLNNEGLLCGSASEYRDLILESVLELSGAEKLDDATIAALDRLLPQPDGLLCFEVEKLLRRDFPTGPVSKIPTDLFPRYFAHNRALRWALWSIDCTLWFNDGARTLLDHIRRRKYFAAMYTDLPRTISVQTIAPLLQASDLFDDTTLLPSDDSRLQGHLKGSAVGWQLLANVAYRSANISPEELVAVECKAAGAAGALSAGYGAVVVVPDAEAGPIDGWDFQHQLETHLQDHPDDSTKLTFLKSLAHIQFN